VGSFLGDRTLLANTSPFYGVGPVDLEPGGGAAPVERLTLTTRSVLRTPRAGPASLFCDLSAQVHTNLMMVLELVLRASLTMGFGYVVRGSGVLQALALRAAGMGPFEEL